MRSAPYYKSGPSKRRKAPRNDELYEMLHGARPDATLHRALADAAVTAKNYVKGKEEGIW